MLSTHVISSIFVSKDELLSIKKVLREAIVHKNQDQIKNWMQKIIAHVKQNVDMSLLYPEVTLCIDTKDIMLKKMVYLFATTYCSRSIELAHISIKAMLNDCRDFNPRVRAVAIRSLCSMRIASILDYVYCDLQNALQDNSAHVRRAAVVGVLKIATFNREAVLQTDLVDRLYQLIRDHDVIVVADCLTALSEILAKDGGLAVNRKLIVYLLNRITEFTEWGQCIILRIVSSYKPNSTEESYQILNILEQCLRIANSAVIMGAVQCFLHLTDDLPEIQSDVYHRLRQPLLTLFSSEDYELMYCILSHIKLIIEKCPGMFNDAYRHFFIHHGEPTYLKILKITVLAQVADGQNIGNIIMESNEYVKDLSIPFGRKCVEAMAQMILRLHDDMTIVTQLFGNLLDLLDIEGISYHIQLQTISVLRDLLRKYPSFCHDVLKLLPMDVIDYPSEEQALTSYLWILGEFGEHYRRAPYILEALVKNLVTKDEASVHLSSCALAELLVSCVKLFFKRPPEMQKVLGRLFAAIFYMKKHPKEFVLSMDVYDRAQFFWRLLKHYGSEHNSNKTEDLKELGHQLLQGNRSLSTSWIFIESVNRTKTDCIFKEFNTLSVVYDRPQAYFVINEENIVAVIQDREAWAAMEKSQETRTDNKPRSSFRKGIVFVLQSDPKLTAETYAQEWDALYINSSLDFPLDKVPSLNEVEEMLRKHCIYTMAAKNMETIQNGTFASTQLFVFGQDTVNNYFYAKIVITAHEQRVGITAKGDNFELSAAFVNLIRDVLQMSHLGKENK